MVVRMMMIFGPKNCMGPRKTAVVTMKRHWELSFLFGHALVLLLSPTYPSEGTIFSHTRAGEGSKSAVRHIPYAPIDSIRFFSFFLLELSFVG
jgi:hypothetical protein